MITQGHQDPVVESSTMGLGEGDGELMGVGVSLGVGDCGCVVGLGDGRGEPSGPLGTSPGGVVGYGDGFT